jgi:uncharacterized protein
MKRHLMTELLAWKQGKKRKPLILQGVRQVGKTYLLMEFGRNHFKKVHHLNFEKQVRLKAIFEQDLDPERIINELRFQLGANIDIEHDLLVFDEIQACPNALTSLKYFCEDMPELALCSAGSLLGLHLNEGSYPVGKVDMMHLHPMTFTEFLSGIGDTVAADFISNYNMHESISDIKHQRLWERLKHYFITGGLPEVVAVFSDQQDNLYEAMQLVRKKQGELIKAYYADMAKHSGKVNAMHIDRTWHAVPTQLAGQHNVSTNRFKFKGVIPRINRYRQLIHVIDWLEAAELVIRLPIVESFEQPIAAYTKENQFKLMLFDVGLLGAMNDISPNTILEYAYGTYKGYFAENFVAQQLVATGFKSLYNWQEERSEIEFLLQHESAVIPIEVKSGKIVRAKSLAKYITKYSPPTSIILSANPPSQNKAKTITYLPLYLAEKIVAEPAKPGPT